jgi:hypothetical protein
MVGALSSLGCQPDRAAPVGSVLAASPPARAERQSSSPANGCSCATTVVAAHHFQHVVIIVLENTDVEAARKIDYFRQLAAEGASFADFHGVTHPSYSNYLAMVAGRHIFSLWDIQRNLDECSIADLLHAKGLTWKSYAEGYPEPSDPQMPADQCFTGDRLGGYARKHVPFMSFTRVQQKQCGNIVNASAFASDRASGNLPNYAFYSPDLDHDGHDTGIAEAAVWLQGFLDPLHAEGAWPEGTLIVVTFDESRDRSSSYGNHIYTVLLGNMIRPGAIIPGRRDHYDVLRMIEDNFGVCPLADGDGAARPITGIWK